MQEISLDMRQYEEQTASIETAPEVPFPPMDYCRTTVNTAACKPIINHVVNCRNYIVFIRYFAHI